MFKPPLITIFIAGLTAISLLRAGAADVRTAAEQEEARREASVKLAQAAIAEGDKAYKDKHYDVAAGEYKVACDHLAESPLTHKLRAQALEDFGQASVRLAEQRIAEGRFEDAKVAVNAVLDKNYYPTYKPAIQLLAHLNDPEYFNATMGPKFEDRIHEVQRLFVEAKGFFDTGRYDLALKRYDQILDDDPTNAAARKGQEDVLTAKARYGNEAYNETRAKLLYDVTKRWETAPRKYVERQIVRIDMAPINPHNNDYIRHKLESIVIPVLNFREATVRDAIEFLHKKSIDLDTMETDPTRKGINIVLKLQSTPGSSTPPAGAGGLPPDPTAPVPPAPAPAPAGGAGISPADTRITLSLTNIPMSAALDYITKLAGLKVKIDPYAVTIVPLSENTEVLITKEYKVPPGWLTTGATATSSLAAPAPGAVPAAPGAAVATPIAPTSLSQKLTALDYLKGAGVQFPPGASANFLPTSSKLVVRDTQEQLDLVDQIVDNLNSVQPTQVNIESKFVEIQQTNYKELSFDYSLGTGNVGRVQYQGGNTLSPTITFPFANIVGGEVGSNLRSGGNAISNNAVDSLLSPSAATTSGMAAPATFAIGGVATTAQFQALIRALNQKKGIDLLSAPSVTTKSGQRAVIEVVVEFRYPTEFNPPQVPNINAALVAGGAVGAGGGTGYIAVTPTTPTAFETRNTGVTLEVEPVIGPDGETIDLNLAPQVVEFDGFVDYGTPIYGPPIPKYSLVSAAQAAIIDPFFPTAWEGFPFISGYGPPTVVTGNSINQPIFDTRKVTTSVSVWDGQTVILGGLVREDVQKVEDKIPGLGDLPIIGRLFRSSVDQHTKRNLVMFVTAHLINPAGELVHGEEENEEQTAPLAPVEPLTLSSLPEVPLPK